MDCEDCNEVTKKDRGCFEDSKSTTWNLDGWEFKRCPIKMVKEESFEWIRFYRWFKNGVIPTLMNLKASNKFLEAVDFIEIALSERSKNGER